MLEVNDLGTDISSDWQIVNGDLVIVENEDNISQSILNRLQCLYDGLDYYYTDYGSFLSHFLGFKQSDETLEFIKIETEKSLSQDPRLNDFNVEISYNANGIVEIAINISVDEDTDFSMNLVLDENKVVDIVDDAVRIEE